MESKLRILLGTLLCGAFHTLYAQASEGMAKSQGDLGPDITTSSTEKYEVRMAAEGAGIYAPRRERLAASDLIRTSSFAVDEFLHSGECVVNGPMGDYVNDVLDRVLADSSDLRGQLRIYIARDPAVNAFATDQGVIVVNMGLLARVRNEAQLAFVLGHEVIHYERRHSLNSAIEDARRTSRSYRPERASRTMFSAHEYDRSLETEADLQGWELVQGGTYDQGAMLSVFDILDSADVSMYQRPFDVAYLARLGLTSLDSSFADTSVAVVTKAEEIAGWSYVSEDDTTASVVGKDDKSVLNSEGSRADEAQVEHDDDESTHPAVSVRRAAIQARMDSTQQGERNHLGEDRFRTMQAIAREELALLLTRDDQHVAALYQAFAHQAQTGSSELDDIAATDALVHLVLKVNGAEVTTDLGHERNGAEEVLREWVRSLSAADLNAIALCWSIDRAAHYPQSAYFGIVRDRLLQEMVAEHGLAIKGDSLVAKKKAGPLTAAMITGEPSSHTIKTLLTAPGMAETPRPVPGSLDERTEKEWNAASKKTFAAGIDKLVFLDPYAMHVDQRKERSNNPFRGERHERSMVEGAERAAERLDMQVDVLHASRLEPGDTQELNDIMVLNDWFDRAELNEGFVIPPAVHDEALKVMERHGTDYLVRAALIGVVAPPRNMMAKYFSLMIPMLWPVAVTEVWGPQRELVFLYTVIDVRTGKVVVANVELMKTKDSTPQVKQMVYDTFRQIHQQP